MTQDVAEEEMAAIPYTYPVELGWVLLDRHLSRDGREVAFSYRVNRSSIMMWHHVAIRVREADRLSPFYGDRLRGEAVSLREAEASQPQDCREPTCQTITTRRSTR